MTAGKHQTRPRVHLICNAHLDPAWQWQWEEGCSEALSTFHSAVSILKEHPSLIFNHNEALLYRWVNKLDRSLFRDIQKLVKAGRWHISGGWYLQPDVNLPGTESLIRQIQEGRQFFWYYFKKIPLVAYNFDSFGHSAGLPQILTKAGYKMYIHMRPNKDLLELPASLYRWRGADGSEILAYRIHIGLYHTEYSNIEERLEQGVRDAVRYKHDIAVFWGIGDHGGGATRQDLKLIDAFRKKEHHVDIFHSTPDTFYHAVKKHQNDAPVYKGGLQRVFTGCYTSMAGLKRRAQHNLHSLIQCESLRAALWWTEGLIYPENKLDQAWRSHLFNDFHDILPGTCIEPAERAALDLYGHSLTLMRRSNLESAVSINKGKKRDVEIPVTVINTTPSISRIPIEAEFMISHRPKWEGSWHIRLLGTDCQEVVCQEEQPEALLPFNGWRRKCVFLADLPAFGAKKFQIQMKKGQIKIKHSEHALEFRIGSASGLIESLRSEKTPQILQGPLLMPLAVEDMADTWGTDQWAYRKVTGRFRCLKNSIQTIEKGPVRTIFESKHIYRNSHLTLHALSYSSWPVLEFRMRINWNEEQKRLKLSIPTIFDNKDVLCEIPGGNILRPADGQEHVHGRWLILEGKSGRQDSALGIAHTGLHGFDCHSGELRLSVLRSVPYCQERGFHIRKFPDRKYMDLGIHEIRILITLGKKKNVLGFLPALADWLNTPPLVYSHLPTSGKEFVFLDKPLPGNIRMLALKRSRDKKALILRFQECSGIQTSLQIPLQGMTSPLKILLKPLEIKTIRFEKNGLWHETDMVEKP